MAISTTSAVYTRFELFKNTGFSPCVINNRPKADPNTNDFIVSTYVDTQDEFCAVQAGFPILIPTEPSQLSFFP